MSRRRCVAAVLPLMLAACAASPPASRHQPDPSPAAAPDASYDWHGLIVMPFGTLLKESPVPLHEVLLFHDVAEGAGVAASKDCFATEPPPPRFAGQESEHFLLCFEHDRLARIETSVHQADVPVRPADDAQQRFARLCAQWSGTLAAAGAVTGDAACTGRDGDIAFAAHLGGAEGARRLSMTLIHVAPEPEHAGAHEQ